jgi:hypothetical protein
MEILRYEDCNGAEAGTAGGEASRVPAGKIPDEATAGSGPAAALMFSIIRVYSPGCARFGGVGIGAETRGTAPGGDSAEPTSLGGGVLADGAEGAGTNRVARSDSR